MEKFIFLIPLVAGYVIDLLLGDPDNQPHPIRTFGNLIFKGEQKFNSGSHRFLKGAALTIVLCVFTYAFFRSVENILSRINVWLAVAANSIWVWYGLANKNLITEGLQVFIVLEKQGLEAGRTQLSRIVGRDTSQLSAQQIRIAVLETMSENLSDGVVAPLFFYAIGGVPAMMFYKMVNTLDSMIGYRNEKFEQFGKFAARLDDVVNFIPARITALLMIALTGSRRGFDFVIKYGSKHKSPNSGYPEAALAGILDSRFGGPNFYKNLLIDKPYIGTNDREILPREIFHVRQINHKVCFTMIVIICIIHFFV